MKKYIFWSSLSVAFMIMSVVINYLAIDKPGYIYHFGLMIPIVLFVLLIAAIILEARFDHKAFMYIKTAMMMAVIIALGVMYIDLIIKAIPEMKDAFMFFYGEGWRILVFTLLFFIPLAYFIAVSFALFMPVGLLLMSLIITVVVFIKQLKYSDTVDLN